MTIAQLEKLRKAHDEAIDRAMAWARASALNHKTEGPFNRYEKAESAFARTLEEILTARR